MIRIAGRFSVIVLQPRNPGLLTEAVNLLDNVFLSIRAATFSASEL